QELKEIGQCEKDGVQRADLFILILPGGKGSHIEMGMAIAFEKKVYLYSENSGLNDFQNTSAFYHLDRVDKFMGTLEEFFHYLMKCEVATHV
ncbi:group-specific protein, partial [Priestia flexa]|uniref:group-specific protein n=1 Tax=Priestia flexa TaxID=86664 RepID=UPI000E682260